MLISLDLPNGDNLKADSTPLMYQGLEVGTLTKLTLLPGGKVSGELTIDPSVTGLMRSGTRIEMRAPKLSLHQPEQPEQPADRQYAGTGPGRREGEPQDHFSVLPASETLLQKPDVLTVQLSAPETYGIDAGQPVMLYGVKIG
ncbi:mammalian cell entry related domain-containing protein [Plautia stali symbiont]|nr:mammalian cell entry related domain-containing protein [Plautia stali symbiont]